MAWPKGRSRKPQIDAMVELAKRIDASGTLTAEEKAEARQRAYDHVTKKRKEKAIDQYFDAAVKAEEQALNPFEAMEQITIDLPEYTSSIVINGTPFDHGCTYTVRYSVARSLADIQARAWEHQREIDGRRRMGDQQRRPENQTISPSRPGRSRVTTSSNMRV